MKNAGISQTIPQAMAYSIDEVVRLTKISRASIYEEMKSGKLPFKKFRKRTLVLHDDLTGFLNSLDAGNDNHE